MQPIFTYTMFNMSTAPIEEIVHHHAFHVASELSQIIIYNFRIICTGELTYHTSGSHGGELIASCRSC
jgi:hypothetical protein